MFCGKCGIENSDTAKFCKSCGSPLVNVNKTSQEAKVNESVEKQTIAKPVNIASTKNKKASSLPKFIVLAVLFIGILAATGFFVIKSMRVINLNKYIVIDTEGYEAYGKARVSIDWDSLEKKYSSKILFEKSASNKYGRFLSLTTPIEVLKDSVNVRIDKYNNLSNGDKIKYTWDVDKDINKYTNYKIKYTDETHTVKDLKEIGTFDAFADVEVEFSGIMPFGTASINYLGSDVDSYDFSLDKASELSNGDTVKVSLPSNKIEYYIDKLGKVPAELEKEYSVSGLESYVKKVSEIDEEALNSMKSQAEDIYNAEAARDWDKSSKLENLTYIGNYLLTSKEKGNQSNYFYVVYKANVRNIYSNSSGSYDKVNSIYWYTRYRNLIVGTDGKIKFDISDYETPRKNLTIDSGVMYWFSTHKWEYSGYGSIDDLYKDAVVSKVDKYNHEDSINDDVASASAEVTESESAQGVETQNNGEYILPDLDKRLITTEELDKLTEEQFRLAKNEIYARHGRKFKDKTLQEYFDSCSWYQGTIEANDFKEEMLTEIELANRDIMVAYGKTKGYK